MTNPKDVLVITTSSSNLKIKKHIKPVTAHIVTGTNLFSDISASIADVFGGRSNSYQKQLASLYNEAIEQIKIATYEIGGNCVIGFNIDMDEISGKGKSMFMLTAIGTAVIVDYEESQDKNTDFLKEKFENVSNDYINTLRIRKEIIKKAETNNLELSAINWDIIIPNQIYEILPYVLKKYSSTYSYEDLSKQFIKYFECLETEIIKTSLYSYIKQSKNNDFSNKLADIINDLKLYDFEKCIDLIETDNFNCKKIGLRILTFNKSYYNKKDLDNYKYSVDFIKSNFPERGIRSIKKQMLSKEREIWTCECTRSNEIDEICNDCTRDIFGFKLNELKPIQAVKLLEEKIILIKEYIN